MTDTMNGGPSSDARAMMAYDAGKKSGVVAYLLWLFLGGLGAHRFYMGKTAGGVMQLLLFVFGWATVLFIVGVFLLIPLAIWVLVDAFLIPGWLSAHNQRLALSLSGG